MPSKRTILNSKLSIPNSSVTPYLLIDGTQLERNILRMANVARENGVALRPHVKTHKIPRIAREQLRPGPLASPLPSSPRQR